MGKKESFLCMSVRRVGAQVRKEYTHLNHFNRKSKFFSVILASKTVNAQTTHVASPYIVAYIQKWRVVELLSNGLFSIYQQNLQGLVKVSIVIASECLFEMYYTTCCLARYSLWLLSLWRTFLIYTPYRADFKISIDFIRVQIIRWLIMSMCTFLLNTGIFCWTNLYSIRGQTWKKIIVSQIGQYLSDRN